MVYLVELALKDLLAMQQPLPFFVFGGIFDHGEWRSSVTGFLSLRAAFQNYECQRVLVFIADGKVVAGDAECLQVLRQFWRKLKLWFTERIVPHFDIVQADRMAQPYSGGFSQRLLGCKAFGEVARGMRLHGAFRLLVCGEQALREGGTMARNRFSDARHTDDVGADTKDHRRNKAFMFFTACSSPMKIASEMMAWPMLSSVMCGMATMACTL